MEIGKTGPVLQFRNCQVLQDHKIIKDDLWVYNGVILNPEKVFFDSKVRADIQIDSNDALICPGFIDVQINGELMADRTKHGSRLWLECGPAGEFCTGVLLCYSLTILFPGHSRQLTCKPMRFLCWQHLMHLIILSGAFGTDFSLPSKDVEAGVAQVAKGILAHGVTSFCPTVITSSPEVYRKILPCIHRTSGSIEGAGVLGKTSTQEAKRHKFPAL